MRAPSSNSCASPTGTKTCMPLSIPGSHDPGLSMHVPVGDVCGARRRDMTGDTKTGRHASSSVFVLRLRLALSFCRCPGHEDGARRRDMTGDTKTGGHASSCVFVLRFRSAAVRGTMAGAAVAAENNRAAIHSRPNSAAIAFVANGHMRVQPRVFEPWGSEDVTRIRRCK